MKTRIVMWDWKEEAAVEDINLAMGEVFDGKNCPYIGEPDTGSDQCAVVVSSIEIPVEDIQKMWDEFIDPINDDE